MTCKETWYTDFGFYRIFAEFDPAFLILCYGICYREEERVSQFSERLREYIERSQLTEQQLAKASGFTRSYIALMKNGLRISPDTEKIGKLLSALSLTTYEKDQIWADYMRAKFGDDTYELRRQMVSLIEKFNQKPSLKILSSAVYQIPEVETIYGKHDLEYLIKALIEEEANKENGHVKMILQPELDLLQDILTMQRRSHPGLVIEQVLVLEQGVNISTEGKMYNMRAFEWMTQMILSGDEGSCRFYYYYDRIRSVFNQNTLLPYLILTSKYAVSISIDMEYAIVSTGEEKLKLFNELFEKRKQMCTALASPVYSPEESVAYQISMVQESNCIYTLRDQPYMAVFSDPELIRKYLLKKLDARDRIIDLFKEEQNLVDKGGRIISYFTKSGLQRFAQNGEIDGSPVKTSFPVQKADRIRVLNKLIQLIQKKQYSGFLINDDMMKYPKELIINVYDNRQVLAFYLNEENKARLFLQEHTLGEMLYSFLEGLGNSQYVLPVKDTLDFLTQVKKELES